MTDPVRDRSPHLVRFFTRIMTRQMQGGFHALRLSRAGRPVLPAGRPVIVYLNHPSWWDAALIIVLAGLLFAERRGYGPIDRAALVKYPFMARIGLYGIETAGPRGGAAFLRAGRRILDDPGAMLWITAEGALTDPRVRPVRLRPGLAHLIRLTPQAAILPLAVEYPFWSERAPEALCRFGELIDPAAFPSLDKAGWTALLERRLTATMDDLAAEAMARDRAAFDRLLRGQAGIGGLYDLWRRARAAWRGEDFHPEHGRPEP